MKLIIDNTDDSIITDEDALAIEKDIADVTNDMKEMILKYGLSDVLLGIALSCIQLGEKEDNFELLNAWKHDSNLIMDVYGKLANWM